jgi:1,4-dihydroxy-2-naphthoyl-CoA hydrolase
MNTQLTAEYFNSLGKDHLPALMGVVVTEVGDKFLAARLEVRQSLMAPNGYLHAGTVVTLADTACGYACIAHLPPGAKGFTTLELKSNFLGTARDGAIACEAKAVHIGRTTHVWDALVHHCATGKLMATFRCTQMILWP